MSSNTIKNPILRARMQSLESILTNTAGVPVEITIRAINKFTFTFDGKNDKAMNKLQAFFLGKLTDCGYDRECNMSYAYLDV